jgi:hypothetical protein
MEVEHLKETPTSHVEKSPQVARALITFEGLPAEEERKLEQRRECRLDVPMDIHRGFELFC